MTDVKSNKIEDDDPDFKDLALEQIKKQLKENGPDYDGSTLVLGGKQNDK